MLRKSALSHDLLPELQIRHTQASSAEQSKCPHEPIRLRRATKMSGSTETEGTKRNVTVKKPAKVTKRDGAPQPAKRPLEVSESRTQRNPRSLYADTAVATTYRRVSSNGVIADAANASACATGRRHAPRNNGPRQRWHLRGRGSKRPTSSDCCA
jgi:hypothetical protein